MTKYRIINCEPYKGNNCRSCGRREKVLDVIVEESDQSDGDVKGKNFKTVCCPHCLVEDKDDMDSNGNVYCDTFIVAVKTMLDKKKMIEEILK